jgi:hypothetical protein
MYRRSLRLDICEEHLIGMSVSICRTFAHIITTLTLENFVTMASYQIVATVTLNTTVAQGDHPDDGGSTHL